MFIAIVVVIVLVLAGLLAYTRRGRNDGQRDVDRQGVHDTGAGGAARDNTPRGGNAAGR